ncbi:thiamine-phosphate kinase [Erythrobacter sp. YT30]|uniref:thiamine-phosphate kinase n=1 Tax=Erythrobacter sp. YT30 TaxID=1735012 RepID=UPI00076C0AAE|nr:thiamine-phosphate kinase [Erythrobacter sp. YT30]KWV90538.1 thiamine-monophosphate kinase [Erythrobacter sp. YT30]
MNELEFLKALRALPLHDGACGLEDDCAVLEVGSETLILTHDAMAEGTHFRSSADPYDVAWKLVATNLSDLAAKGAEPIGILIGYALGENDARFIEGLRAVLSVYDVPLLGGDTISANGPQSLGLTAIGRATHTPVPIRSGAIVGDAVYVTGILGRAMLGFDGDPNHAEAFNRPRPLLSEGKALAPHVTAMMDVSDGLLLDSWRLARASNVTIQLDSEAVPVADPTRREDAIRWGDDYELLFTAPADMRLPVAATRIGVVGGSNIAPLLLDGEPVSTDDSLGYEHASNS